MNQEANKKNHFLFEISWEVCNKVGGIYTVLRTKAKQAMQEFGENYVLIGPQINGNDYFIETSTPFIEKIKQKLLEKGINCRVGQWDLGYDDPSLQPTVILVSYKDRFPIDALLYSLWSDYGVDSLASNFEYYEPILFATAAAEIVEVLANDMIEKKTTVLAHCHEWLAGAGVLYLKKNLSRVSTIFTAHATVLGRALAGHNKLVHNLSSNFEPDVEAKKLGVFAKHSLEKAAAENADCFSTVSAITAEEAGVILGKYPDKVSPNGLDIEKNKQLVEADRSDEDRSKLLEIASKVVGKNFESNTKLWITSGRYEFHNKGYDLLLTALDELEKQLSHDAPDIVVFFCVAATHRNKDDSLLDIDRNVNYDQRDAFGISVFKNNNPELDSIIQACKNLGFNSPERKIHVIYSDAYLNGSDGVFDMVYERVLINVDLSLFLSFYEPWGYTPPESISYGTPTVTTDLSGFGSWVNSVRDDCCGAVYVLERRNKNYGDVVKHLNGYLLSFLKYDEKALEETRNKAELIAKLTDWKSFYGDYLDSYEQAIEFNNIFHGKFGEEGDKLAYLTVIHEQECLEPRFRSMQYEGVLPEELEGLRDVAYNLWWSWHESVKVLFKSIDADLWNKVARNPVHFLNAISMMEIKKKIKDVAFMEEYREKMNFFNEYVKERNLPEFCDKDVINYERPIAYFCMEYGLDECFPIYSGGLGILAGDYLKTMSDLNVPVVAVGIFYKDGYFSQTINSFGEQVAFYKVQNVNQIPMHKLNDEAGKELLISIDLLGRTVFAKVWEAEVGRVKLYLLDTDVHQNSEEDREITNRLYAGLRENRLMQEIILGIGGVRLLEEKLKIKPSLYHLNEGHSAFLILERLKNFHQREGLSFEEACEAVKSSSVFTTHTPVPAGNEVFANILVQKYFSKMQDLLGVPVTELIKMAQDVAQGTKVFSMTALALQFSVGANAVSKIHGKIARSMWDGLWGGFLKHEVPIGEVTNGIHLSTWVGTPLKKLFDEYLGYDWKVTQLKREVWDKVHNIPDDKLWQIHKQQKEQLLNVVRKRIVKEYAGRNESKNLISSSLGVLDSNALVIGISRRFATYKRSTLILRDEERLTKILNDETRPVVILVAGKAHPLDSAGKNLIRDFILAIRNSKFNGRIIFLENYDMSLAKLLVQGVDIWLNNPILGREACGTSGMKAALNGSLNFSVSDGWWDEAYSENGPKIGWTIPSMTSLTDMEKRNDMENMYLLDILENEIVPLYYNKTRSASNNRWVSIMKNSIINVGFGFNSQRMVKDYFDSYYCQVAHYADRLANKNFSELRDLVAWQSEIKERFSTVKIKTILINGVKDGKIMPNGKAKIKVLLFSGKLKAKELRVELVLVKSEEEKVSEPKIIPLKLADQRDVGILTYQTEFTLEDTGFYNYGVRVLPYNKGLLREQDIGMVYWG